MQYSFKIEYIPDRRNAAADMYSRHPFSNNSDMEEESSHTEKASVAYASCWPKELRSVTWEQVREASVSEPESTELVSMIQRGFPSQREEVPEHLRQFS